MRIKKLMQAALMVVFAVLYFGGLALSLQNVQELRQIYPVWSVRGQQDIADDQIVQSRRSFAGQADNTLWPTFWTEKTEQMKTFRKTASHKTIYYDGNPTLVFPAEFLSGGYPGEFEQTRAAVSVELAWQLWGSLEVTGESFTIAEKEYTVSGVFKGDEATAIAGGAGQALTWKNVELENSHPTATVSREAIETVAGQMGLGSDVHYIDGQGMAMLLNLLAYLPVAVALFLVCKGLIGLLPRRSWIKRGAVFSFCLLLAFSLPWILAQFPPWLLPTKWSDFAFWIKLFETLQGYVTQWFLLVPQDKDLLAKMAIIKAVFCLLVTGAAEIVLWRSTKGLLQDLKHTKEH